MVGRHFREAEARVEVDDLGHRPPGVEPDHPVAVGPGLVHQRLGERPPEPGAPRLGPHEDALQLGGPGRLGPHHAATHRRAARRRDQERPVGPGVDPCEPVHRGLHPRGIVFPGDRRALLRQALQKMRDVIGEKPHHRRAVFRELGEADLGRHGGHLGRFPGQHSRRAPPCNAPLEARRSGC